MRKHAHWLCGQFKAVEQVTAQSMRIIIIIMLFTQVGTAHCDSFSLLETEQLFILFNSALPKHVPDDENS